MYVFIILYFNVIFICYRSDLDFMYFNDFLKILVLINIVNILFIDIVFI